VPFAATTGCWRPRQSEFFDQVWEMTPVPDPVQAVNRASSRCLIVHGSNNVNGAPLLQYDCLPQFTDQLWDIVSANGGVQLKNRATGRCALVSGSNNTNDAAAVQYDCLPQFTDQLWDIVPSSGA
jgi:hypothetical protein